MMRRWLTVGLLLSICTAALAAGAGRSQIAIEAAARGADRTWQALENGAGAVEARDLFSAALAYCEADRDLDRLDGLFAAAADLQNRDPRSTAYGNFRWQISEETVRDLNAVEFCMRSAAPIWLRHRAKLGPDAQAELRTILGHAVEGCLRHRVPPAYTNISLMNAANLILLGEALQQPQFTTEGRARLDAFCVYTWEAGVHEFVSPTYYGVDLECLLLLHELTGIAAVREQADALLQLFWRDVALNWFPPAQRLAGAHSRSYHYLRSRGGVEGHLWMAGWFAEPRMPRLAPATARWGPPLGLRQIAQGRLPRLVRQSWGLAAEETRTHYLLPDVTLSTAGAHFGPTDAPLTVDLGAGGRGGVRCYVIPDARQDPFGTSELALGPHSKALHSRPFWASAQRTTDAVGLAVYREGDLIGDPRALATHFVMPRDVDACWLGDRPVELPEQGFARRLDPARPVAIVNGSAVVGVRILWTRGFDGASAPVTLAWDGPEAPAMRLTVNHTSGSEAPRAKPGVALWVRVGSDIRDVRGWLAEFAAAPLTVNVSADRVGIEAAGVDGLVQVAAGEPWLSPESVLPEPCRVPLELDGADLGRPILGAIDAVAEYRRLRADAPEVAAVPAEGATIEAEQGLTLPPAWEDAAGVQALTGGSVMLRATFARTGRYLLEARLTAPEAGEFGLRVLTESPEPAPEITYQPGRLTAPRWVRLTDRPVTIPRGRVGLQMDLPVASSVDAVRVRPMD